MNTLEKLSKELLNAATSGEGGAAAKAAELSNYLSTRISEAINPINCITAPFTILVLRQYVEEISRHYPGMQDAAEVLKRISKTAAFVIPTKRDEDNGWTR